MRRMDGWERKVLRMPVCQQETRPRRKPGRNIIANIAASTSRVCSREKPNPGLYGEIRASPFPISESRQATEMIRNLGAR